LVPDLFLFGNETGSDPQFRKRNIFRISGGVVVLGEVGRVPVGLVGVAFVDSKLAESSVCVNVGKELNDSHHKFFIAKVRRQRGSSSSLFQWNVQVTLCGLVNNVVHEVAFGTTSTGAPFLPFSVLVMLETARVH